VLVDSSTLGLLQAAVDELLQLLGRKVFFRMGPKNLDRRGR